ncbi:universal stress protein [Zobellia uliginosa]|uniref:universal stress protein n=1 Tax=Zobellia uliginosa TaxID=143224 RepID=UPI001C07C495|nr:universal stress protein [Zobellia uliginosa]MBU2945320.1 universal stress protein [Zobellia uliginosa]
MGKISTILIPFDFTKASKKALEYAVGFVGRLDDIKIVLAYVSGNCNLELLPENFERLEKEYAGVLKNKLEWEIQDGKLNNTLEEIAKKDKIDLVIMGTSGECKQNNKQTNTANFVLMGKFPVLVVPQNCQDFRLKSIALVIGREEIDDTRKLETLLKIARKCNAQVHVLTVENQPILYGYSEEEEKNESAIEYYLETFYKERVFIKNDDVVDGINTYAIKNDIDVVAILPRIHNKNSNPSEGELTQMLILDSKVPTLVLE